MGKAHFVLSLACTTQLECGKTIDGIDTVVYGLWTGKTGFCVLARVLSIYFLPLNRALTAQICPLTREKVMRPPRSFLRTVRLGEDCRMGKMS